MNKPSDELHKLIHSLTANEKGYFAKFAQRQSELGKAYIRLFNAIQQQEVYNEAVLRKKFKDLAVLKSYLKELILQTLRFFGTDNNNPNLILDKNMIYASILARKGLLKSAAKLIEQSIEIADDNSLFEKKLVLLSQLLDIKMREIIPEKKWKFLYDMNNITTATQKQQYNITRLVFEQRKIYTLTEGRSIGMAVSKRLSEIDVKFIISRKNSLSVNEKSICLNSLGAYYDLMEDTAKMYQAFAENLSFNKKLFHPAKANSNEVARYSRALYNFIKTAIATNHLKEAKRELANWLKLKENDPERRTTNVFYHILLLQDLAWQEKAFERSSKETVRLMEQKEIKEKLPVFTMLGTSILTNLILFQFISGQYKEAYLTMQEFFLLNKKLKDEQLETDTLLLNVLLQFEMGNEDLAYQSAQLLYRSQSKKTKTTINGIVLALRKFLTERKKNLSAPYPSSLNYKIYRLLPLNHWLLSKSSGRPLGDIMRESKD